MYLRSPLTSLCMLHLHATFVTTKLLVHHLKASQLLPEQPTRRTPCPVCGKSKTWRLVAETLVALRPSPTLPSTDILIPLLEGREGGMARNTRLVRPEKDPVAHSTTSSSSHAQRPFFNTAPDKGPPLTNMPFAKSCLESALAIVGKQLLP
jgi:hypothetical protein